MKRSTAIVVACFAFLAADIFAVDFAFTTGQGMGGTAELSRSPASVLVNVPSGAVRPGEWQVEAGYTRLYELSDLDRLLFAAATRWKKLTFAVGASQFGKSDLYAEQVLKGSVAWHYDSLTVGGTLSALQVQLGGGYGTLRTATGGAGVSYRTRRLHAAVAVDNLNSPTLLKGSPEIEPTLSCYTELIGLGSYSVLGRLTTQKKQKPQFGVGQIWQIAEQARLFYGVSTEPLEYGAGLEFNIGRSFITYAVTVHPVLGLTHTASLAFSTRESRRKKERRFE